MSAEYCQDPNPDSIRQAPGGDAAQACSKRQGLFDPRIGATLTGLGILGIALGLRWHELMGPSFWFDEAASWIISQFPVSEMLDAVSRDAHPPLFFFALKGWQSICGTTVFAARLFSLLCGMLAVIAAWWLGGTLLNQHHADSKALSQKSIAGAAFIALLVAINPLPIEMSQQCRPYSLGLCFTFLATGFLIMAMRTPHVLLNWFLFSIFALALTWTHYFGLFTVMAFFAFGIFETVWQWGIERCDPKLTRARWLGLAVSCMALQIAWWNWIPVFQQQSARLREQMWLPALSIDRILQVSLGMVLGGAFHGSLLGWIPISFAASLLVWLFLKCGPEGRLIAILCGLPLVLALGYSQFVRNILEVRYLSFAQGMLLIGTGLALQSFTSRRLRGVAAVLLIFSSAVFCWKHAEKRGRFASEAGLKQAMTYLNQNRHADEVVVAASPFVLASAHALLNDPRQVYVQYSGDHRGDILAGPSLKVQDFQNLNDVLDAHPPVIWTIDVEGNYGLEKSVRVPVNYRPVSQKRFAETYWMQMELVVRGFRYVAEPAAAMESESK